MALNRAVDPRVVLTTYAVGPVPVTGGNRLVEPMSAWEAQHGPDRRLEVRDGAFGTTATTGTASEETEDAGAVTGACCCCSARCSRRAGPAGPYPSSPGRRGNPARPAVPSDRRRRRGVTRARATGS
ncbi:hypothetical protein ABZX69_13170 [Streptomyces sp. NPDC004074]|uniref:hypothetical protein n=1 Tax=Streptomyces sp. NPDC004074 TaxID=3154277 RepID=UPI00339E92B9